MLENVGKFEVAVHDFVLDKRFEAVEDLEEEVHGFFLGEVLLGFQVLLQISFVAVLHDEIDVVGRFLDIVKLDDVVIVAGLQYFDFVLKQLGEFAL